MSTPSCSRIFFHTNPTETGANTQGKNIIERTKTENLKFFQNVNILTIHSGISRKLKDNAYNDRRASCNRASKDMGIRSLRSATLNDLSKVKNHDDRIKSQHVISENIRVLDIEVLYAIDVE